MGIGGVAFRRGRLSWPVWIALIVSREIGRAAWREAKIAWRVRAWK